MSNANICGGFRCSKMIEKRWIRRCTLWKKWSDI